MKVVYHNQKSNTDIEKIGYSFFNNLFYDFGENKIREGIKDENKICSYF